jgi:hypothetical protein
VEGDDGKVQTVTSFPIAYRYPDMDDDDEVGASLKWSTPIMTSPYGLDDAKGPLSYMIVFQPDSELSPAEKKTIEENPDLKDAILAKKKEACAKEKIILDKEQLALKKLTDATISHIKEMQSDLENKPKGKTKSKKPKDGASEIAAFSEKAFNRLPYTGEADNDGEAKYSMWLKLKDFEFKEKHITSNLVWADEKPIPKNMPKKSAKSKEEDPIIWRDLKGQ